MIFGSGGSLSSSFLSSPSLSSLFSLLLSSLSPSSEDFDSEALTTTGLPSSPSRYATGPSAKTGENPIRKMKRSLPTGGIKRQRIRIPVTQQYTSAPSMGRFPLAYKPKFCLLRDENDKSPVNDGALGREFLTFCLFLRFTSFPAIVARNKCIQRTKRGTVILFSKLVSQRRDLVGSRRQLSTIVQLKLDA